MSTPISKNQIVEEGVLDNLLQPLKIAQDELSKTDAALQKLAESMGKIGNAESAKGIRELADAEKELNAVYETKKKVQRESIDVDNEAEKLKKKIIQAASDEAKELALLKEELAAVNREQKANAKATTENLTAYKQLEKETRNAKNESKELGAQLRQLANEGKQNTDEYRALSDVYQSATQRAASLDKELKGLDKSVGDNFRNVGNYESALDGLNAKMAAGGMSMREMSQLIREYQRIAIEAGQTSPIGQQALAQAGQLKDRISDVGAVTKALSTDNINLDATFSVVRGGAGAWQAYAGVVQIAGKQNEDIMRGLQKLAAIQSILNGLKQVEATINKNNIALLRQTTIWQKASAAGTLLYAKATAISTAATGGATAATNALRVAMLALPIVAIIAGIAALAFGINKLIQKNKEASEETKKLTEEKKRLEAETNKENAAIAEQSAKFVGLIAQLKATNAGSKERKDLMKTINSEYGTTLKNIDDERLFQEQLNGVVAQYIALQRAKFRLGKEEKKIQLALEMELKLQERLTRLRKDYDAAAGTPVRQVGILQSIKDVEDQLKVVNKAMNFVATNAAELQAEIDGLMSASFSGTQKKVVEQSKATQKQVEDYQKYILQLRQEVLNEISKLEDEYFNRQLSSQEQEENAVRAKYFRLIEMAKKMGIDITTLEKAQDEELNAIKNKAASEQRAKEYKDAVAHQEQLNKEAELLNLAQINDKEKLNKAERKRQLDHYKKLLELQRMYGESTIETELAIAKLSKEEDKEKTSHAQDIAKKIDDIYNRAADNAIASLQRQTDAAANMYNAFAQLAAQGNIQASQSMAEMIERQEQLQRRQEQIERRKLAMQRATGASAILTKAIESGKPLPEALAEMGVFLATTLPSFYEGTENTGKGGKLDANGGFIAKLHKGERVITENQNRLIGDVSNPVVADVVYKWRTGQLENNAGNSAELMHRLNQKLDNVVKAIQNQPQQIVGLEETLSGMVKLTVNTRKGSHTNSNKFQS